MGKILIGLLLLFVGYALWKISEREGNFLLGLLSTFIYFVGFVVGGLGIADFNRK